MQLHGLLLVHEDFAKLLSKGQRRMPQSFFLVARVLSEKQFFFQEQGVFKEAQHFVPVSWIESMLHKSSRSHGAGLAIVL